MTPPNSSRRNRWCVFTSAGDHHNVAAWADSARPRSWDLITAFYGDDKKIYDQLCLLSDICLPMKGSKFQNLKKIYETWPDIFDRYDFVLIADDDLIPYISNFDAAFALAQLFDLWVCQPAFSPEGKISHYITLHQGEGSSLRLVNFVEVACPIFKRDKLKEFLSVYDGQLLGWGIDWWYCHYLKAMAHRKFAILDEVVVINPHDHQRPSGAREITKLQSNKQRHQEWLQIKAKYEFSEYDHEVFDTIRRGPFESAAGQPHR